MKCGLLALVLNMLCSSVQLFELPTGIVPAFGLSADREALRACIGIESQMRNMKAALGRTLLGFWVKSYKKINLWVKEIATQFREV